MSEMEEPLWEHDIGAFVWARLKEAEEDARGWAYAASGTALGFDLSALSDYLLRDIEIKRKLLVMHEGEHYCPGGPSQGSDYYNYMAGWAEAKYHPQICPLHRLFAAQWSEHGEYRKEWRP